MAGYTQEEILEIMVYANDHADADVQLKYNLSDATLTRWRKGIGVPQPRTQAEILQIVTDGLAAERAYTLPEFCRRWNISLTTYYGYKRLNPEACTPATVALPDEQPPARSAVPPTLPVQAKPAPRRVPPAPKPARQEPDAPAHNSINESQIAALAEDCLLDLPTGVLCERHHVPAGIVHRVRDGNHALLSPDMRRRLQQAADANIQLEETFSDIVASHRADAAPTTKATPKQEPAPMQLVSTTAVRKQAKHRFGRGNPLPQELIVAIAADVLAGKLSTTEIEKRHGVSHTQITRVSQATHPLLPDELRTQLLERPRRVGSRGGKPNTTPEHISEAVEDILAGYSITQIQKRRHLSHATVSRLAHGNHKSMTQAQRTALARFRAGKAPARAAAPAPAPAPAPQPAPVAAPQAPVPVPTQHGQDDVAIMKQTLVDYMLECYRLRERLSRYEAVDTRKSPL